MMAPLPTFLGIGAPKAGTTWLFELLRSHPAIGMSERRKEIHFFDRAYAKGVDWYAGFFRGLEGCDVVGEFTPHYLYCEALTERIAESVPGIDRLLVSLRNPVQRAYSHYWFRVRIDGYADSFEQFLVDKPNATNWGLYGQHLSRLKPWIERGTVLPLIFEEAVRDVEGTKVALANFLQVDPEAFPAETGYKPVNTRYRPRFGPFYHVAIRIANALRRGDQDGMINLAKRFGAKRLFESEEGSKPALMREETRQRLIAIYEPDVARLEDLLDRTLHVWRDAWARTVEAIPTPESA